MAFRLAEILLHLGGQAAQVGIDVLYAAPFAHELLGSLLAYPLHSRHVVGCVTPEGEDVDDLQRAGDAVLGADGGFVHHLVVGSALAGLVLEDMVVDGLPEVLVGSHHIHVGIAACETGGEGAYHVVGLVAFFHHHRDAQGAGDLSQRLHGVDHELGSGRAVGLVLGVGLVAERLGVGVETYRHVSGMLLGEHLKQVFGEAEENGSILPLRIDHRPAEEGVEHPEDQGVAVYDEELVHCLCLTAS